jgi:hypothetical protein
LELLMKKIVLASALGLAALVSSMSAQAVDVTGNFNVRVNLTPVCQLTTNTNGTSTGTTDLIFNYTSFGAAQAPSSSFIVKCTTNLIYTLALDGTGFGGSTTALGLAYSLALAAPAGGGTGTGANQTYTINGTMAAGQAGTCATTAGCTNTTARTITLTY